MISIPLAVILILFGILAFCIPFRYGIVRRKSKAVIDNNIFRLHYRLTFGFLLACAIFLSATTLIEEPMDEMTDGNRVWMMMVKFCIIEKSHNVSEYPLDNSYEVGRGLNETIYERKPGPMYYYQCLTLIIFIQAAVFYMPYKLWAALEGGVTQKMINLYHSATEKTENGIQSGREKLITYLTKAFNIVPSSWFYGLVLMEAFNFINALGGIALVNSLFNGGLSEDNLPLFRSNLSDWDVECNHDTRGFQLGLKTKCVFGREFAPGDFKQYIGMCKFPRTRIDEKFYLFLSFWLIYIAVLSGTQLLSRLLLIVSPRLRSFWTRSRVCLSNPECYEFVFRKCTLSDWFLFDQLCKNLEDGGFNDVINDFAKKLEGKKFRQPIDNYI